MKHPKVIPGRGGLPATSNVPWSAAGERVYRKIVLISFLVMWLPLLMVIFVLFHKKSVLAGILATFGLLLLFTFNLWRFLVNRGNLRAMLMNKPRSIEGLTPWTEHPWKDGDPDAFRFICDCGRFLDMNDAEFFKASKRWSVVCSCGRGHFIPYPPDGPGTPHPVRLHR